MRKMKVFVSIMLLATCCITACSKSSEDKLQQQQPVACDTLDVSYEADVLPIISANCYSCHGNGQKSGSVDLDGYSNLKIYAGNGDLEGTITHASGYPPMPLSQPKLPDCDISIITAWINAGAANN